MKQSEAVFGHKKLSVDLWKKELTISVAAVNFNIKFIIT